MSTADTARTDLLFRQASSTSHDYLLKAVRDIDSIMGDGYAASHPELLGQMIRTAAQDFHTGMLCDAMREIRVALECLTEGIA